jgi:hypothetical protein
MVMGGDFCPWERDFESSSYRKLCDRYTHRSRKKHAKQPKNGSEETVGERYGIPAVTAPTNQEIFYMATRQGKKDNRLSDKEAMHIAETTDVSPKQAKDLAEKHGKDKGAKEARNFKAEG